MNKYIDHTLLKPNSTKDEYIKVITEAKQNNFASACIPPSYVSLASELLNGSDVKVCTVIGFPLGYATTETKVFEAKTALKEGAQEIDMVVNISDVKSSQWEKVADEIRKIREVTNGFVLKVIFETAYLTKDEIVKLCQISTNNKVDFVKTSTGFANEGATVENIRLMKENISAEVQIKASGGVRSSQDAQKMIEAGATRIGTSNGLQIINNEDGKEVY
jgi:deoxyribose-phosphate aldolase